MIAKQDPTNYRVTRFKSSAIGLKELERFVPGYNVVLVHDELRKES